MSQICSLIALYTCELQEKAHKAMDYLWNQRHRSSDLVGTVINIHNGDWIRRGWYSKIAKIIAKTT